MAGKDKQPRRLRREVLERFEQGFDFERLDYRQRMRPARGKAILFGVSLAGLLYVAGFGAGALAAGFGVLVCWKNVDFFNMRLGYRLTRKALEFRPSAVVDPDDPDAVYVDFVPREQWTRIVCDHPSDVGFCKIDTRSGESMPESSGTDGGSLHGFLH